MSRTDEAADWAARIDAGPLGDAERAALDGWLAADMLNKGALLRAQAMLCLVDEAPEQPLAAVEPVRPVRRNWWLIGGLPLATAAAVATMAIGLQPDRARYATEIGEVRRVAMDDGSRAVINTDTSVDTALTRRERAVSIERGEAWFQVAKDTARPFVVSAGPIRVRATGTAFAVRRQGERVTVTVTEGAVEVWNVAAPDARIPARAGQSTTIAFKIDTRHQPRLAVAKEGALAWRDGDIVLDGTSLGDAVAEFNRYNLRQIRIDGAGIAATPMLGYFKSNQPEQFADAAAQVIGGAIRHNGNNIVITKPNKGNKKTSEE